MSLLSTNVHPGVESIRVPSQFWRRTNRSLAQRQLLPPAVHAGPPSGEPELLKPEAGLLFIFGLGYIGESRAHHVPIIFCKVFLLGMAWMVQERILRPNAGCGFAQLCREKKTWGQQVFGTTRTHADAEVLRQGSTLKFSMRRHPCPIMRQPC